MQKQQHTMESLIPAVVGAWIASIWYAGSLQPAFAADTDQLQEVTVTARRTDESLQRTPVAVTALSGDDLARKQIVGLDSLQYSVPSLSVTASGGSGDGVFLSIRGQAQTTTQFSTDSAVGVYVDGVYYARAVSALLDLDDIQHVEVLRGPQGTLFGRNTTGGAINIISNGPTDKFEASLKLGGGNYGAFEALGVLNIPIIGDEVDARFVVKHYDRSGFGEDAFVGHRVNDANDNLYRAELKIAPDGAPWNLMLGSQYAWKEGYGEGQTMHLVAYNPANFPPPVPALDAAIAAPFYTTMSNPLPTDSQSNWNTHATLTVDLDPFTFKSISAASGLKFFSVVAGDASALELFKILTDEKQQQASQEFQLSAKQDNFDWITGVYFFNENTNTHYLDGGVVSYIDRGKHSSLAPYAQSNYNLTDALRLTAGVRWTRDYRKETLNNSYAGICTVLNTVAPSCKAAQSNVFEYPSYTLDLDYQLTPNAMVYVKTSMAHRAGGINTISPTLAPYAPEKVTDYEAGTKTEWFDHKLRVNADAYFTFYKDMQRTILEAGGTYTQSVGEAHIPGVELEMSAVPVKNLELNANLGALAPRYVTFADPILGDLSHSPFLYVSKFTAGVGGTYTVPVSYGAYDFHADWGYQSARWFSQPILGAPSFALQPGVGLLNAQISLQLQSQSSLPLRLTIWGKNLTAVKYNNFVLDLYGTPVSPSVGVATAVRGDPLTFGGNVTYRFE